MNDSPENEVKRMTAVVGAQLPDGWRLRCVAASFGTCWSAAVLLEEFDGSNWWTASTPVFSGVAPSREVAWAKLLSAWSARDCSTVEIACRKKQVLTLKLPAASSVEELCLKLDLM